MASSSSRPAPVPARYAARLRCTSTARALVAILLLVGSAVVLADAPAEEPELVAGMTSATALEHGERMYREGILPSGEPMRALIQRDIEVDGTMFSCESCHLRSGMGSIEGTVITQPTCGSWLFKPLVGAEMRPESQARVPARLDPPPFRPAYDDRTLARAIRVGKDAGGRELSPAMPRYLLSREDMEVMVHYLKHLSAEFSPGVDDTTIHFATVISDGISEVDRQAMVDVLEAHVRDHNSQSRHEERRARGGPFYKEEKNMPYRRYSLSVWKLEGARDTWPAQLEELYRKEPVFALLSGMVTGSWAPVHEFAEKHEIPCLFPITDLPVVSDEGWYTAYFSKGLYQEGAAAARFLRRSDDIPTDAPVVQIVHDTERARHCARGFAEARDTMGLEPATELSLATDARFDAGLAEQLLADHPGAVLAVWLQDVDLSPLAGLVAAGSEPPPAVLLSKGLTGDSVTSLPEELRTFTYITHPYSFAEDEVRSRLSVEQWLRAKQLKVTNFDVQAKMYFMGWTLAGLVKKMRDDFYRDYFLDIFGMMRDQYYSIAVYPRLSFGPGQRYAAKGCYMARLGPGAEPKLEKVSGWVIH